jgi:hypothetical protein
MARTIKEIQQSIIDSIEANHEQGLLSNSKVAEWRLWTYVMAGAIHAFEVILDVFRREVDTETARIAPGTPQWYAQMCYRFQNGHDLEYNEKTAELYYATDDPDSRIIKVATVTESPLVLKVAKLDDEQKITPLSVEELANFTRYVERIKFAGMQVDSMSSFPDLVRYDLTVYYDPITPPDMVEANVIEALALFREELEYDAMFYTQRMLETVTAVRSVVTVKGNRVEHKSAEDDTFQGVDVMVQLFAGYFDYDQDCSITMVPITIAAHES